jgi:hypothetical protein
MSLFVIPAIWLILAIIVGMARGHTRALRLRLADLGDRDLAAARRPVSSLCRVTALPYDAVDERELAAAISVPGVCHSRRRHGGTPGTSHSVVKLLQSGTPTPVPSKLYHFTSMRHLRGVGLYGLTVGDK